MVKSSLNTSGGNFDPFTNELVDLGSQIGQIKKNSKWGTGQMG